MTDCLINFIKEYYFLIILHNEPNILSMFDIVLLHVCAAIYTILDHDRILWSLHCVMK